MDTEDKLYLKRAEDEFLLAQNDMKISTDLSAKELLGIGAEKTFFNSVISHAYYSIFYAAKSFLFSKGIKTKLPDEHKKTYEYFKKIANSEKIDKKLIEIYESESIKAENLINIFFTEKRKRGLFTYNIRSEANIPYAKESIQNAKTFISSIKLLLGGR